MSKTCLSLWLYILRLGDLISKVLPSGIRMGISKPVRASDKLIFCQSYDNSVTLNTDISTWSLCGKYQQVSVGYRFVNDIRSHQIKNIVLVQFQSYNQISWDDIQTCRCIQSWSCLLSPVLWIYVFRVRMKHCMHCLICDWEIMRTCYPRLQPLWIYRFAQVCAPSLFEPGNKMRSNDHLIDTDGSGNEIKPSNEDSDVMCAPLLVRTC